MLPSSRLACSARPRAALLQVSVVITLCKKKGEGGARTERHLSLLILYSEAFVDSLLEFLKHFLEIHSCASVSN